MGVGWKGERLGWGYMIPLYDLLFIARSKL
jgi:hypothetical protein